MLHEPSSTAIYLVYGCGEGSDDSARLCMLVWALAARQCYYTHILGCWPISMVKPVAICHPLRFFNKLQDKYFFSWPGQNTVNTLFWVNVVILMNKKSTGSDGNKFELITIYVNLIIDYNLHVSAIIISTKIKSPGSNISVMHFSLQFWKVAYKISKGLVLIEHA